MTTGAGRMWSASKVFCAAFAGSLGFEWLLVEVYSYFRLQWFPQPTTNSLWATIVVLLSAAIAMGAACVRLLLHPAAPAQMPTFEQSLVDALSTALRERNYADVIRIGVALTRPLFEEGRFSTRLKIGKVVEEAAALSGRKDVQVVALIDSIGWSLVEIGRYEEAKRHIEHGISLSEETDQIFYRAKGQRHLGVILRRTGDFEGARKFYEASLATAGLVPDGRERNELVAGLHYAFASLYYYTTDYSKAMEFIDKAIAAFSTLNDEYRLNMSYVLKGDLQFKLSQKEKALDTFRMVLQRADRNTEKLQVVRSGLGLAEVYVSEHDWERARRSVQQVESINLDEFKAEGERLRRLKSELP
jgi:tetratricopeptide (TPR) repeat protein